jgi:hypothetical protein
VVADIGPVMQETAYEVPKGAGVFSRGQVTTMTSAWAVVRCCRLRIPAMTASDRRETPYKRHRLPYFA